MRRREGIKPIKHDPFNTAERRAELVASIRDIIEEVERVLADGDVERMNFCLMRLHLLHNRLCICPRAALWYEGVNYNVLADRWIASARLRLERAIEAIRPPEELPF